MGRAIYTENAPKPLGMYSQAIKCGLTIYCSGQIGIEPATGQLVAGLENQFEQALYNLQAVLAKTNMDKNQIVKATIFVAVEHEDDFQRINNVYNHFFSDSYTLPARSLVGVKTLPGNALVEIEAIAHK
ncbi:RidA family protein [Fructilactobacillus sp. Tb1]|uniref:RidA family protein n=1 Tax=Fructilactobacillus sp. Tb1 TaxID=3422304 RepID=UPI003D27B715